MSARTGARSAKKKGNPSGLPSFLLRQDFFLYSTMPAPTVLLVDSSTTMKAPVSRLVV